MVHACLQVDLGCKFGSETQRAQQLLRNMFVLAKPTSTTTQRLEETKDCLEETQAV